MRMLVLGPQMREAVMNQAADKLARRVVERGAPLVARSDELHPPQDGELVAGCRQREREGVGEVANAQLVVRECVHKTQAHWVCQNLEDFDCIGDHLWRWQPGACGRNLFCVVDLGKLQRVCRLHT